MVPLIYNILLSLQNALGNDVTPELRAVTVHIDEKKDRRLLRFFYDAEVTWELEDHVSTLLDDVDAGYEVIQLGSNNPIPVQGELAYLRYEKILPKFERKSHAFLLEEKDYPFHAIYRLDMQQALLGRVTPDLRHVSVSAEPETKKLIAHFIYDGEISELNQQLATTAIHDSRVSFPDYEIEFFIQRVDYPNKMPHHGKLLAYWRKEWIFTDNGKIPAISK